jgi:uncharacterized protein with GYD domain
MPKYLFEASYTAEGAKGIIKEGAAARRAAIEKAAASVGGKLECFYFAFGDVDAYVIADLPDNAAAAAMALTVGASGKAATKTCCCPRTKPKRPRRGRSHTARPGIDTADGARVR